MKTLAVEESDEVGVIQRRQSGGLGRETGDVPVTVLEDLLCARHAQPCCPADSTSDDMAFTPEVQKEIVPLDSELNLPARVWNFKFDFRAGFNFFDSLKVGQKSPFVTLHGCTLAQRLWVRRKFEDDCAKSFSIQQPNVININLAAPKARPVHITTDPKK